MATTFGMIPYIFSENSKRAVWTSYDSFHPGRHTVNDNEGIWDCFGEEFVFVW